MSPQGLQPIFDSIWLTIRNQMRFEDFQDGHLGAISDIGQELFKQFWIWFKHIYFENVYIYNTYKNTTIGLEWKQKSLFNSFPSNSESLCHSDASHQVLAQSALRFGRRCLLKNGSHYRRPSWMLEWNKFSSSKSLCLPNASHLVSA